MAQDPPSKPSIPPFNSKRVGDLVKQHREYQKLSQGDLARAADVYKQAISNLERGTVVPTLTTLAAIGNVLGITMEEFHHRIWPGACRRQYEGPGRIIPAAKEPEARIL